MDFDRLIKSKTSAIKAFCKTLDELRSKDEQIRFLTVSSLSEVMTFVEVGREADIDFLTHGPLRELMATALKLYLMTERFGPFRVSGETPYDEKVWSSVRAEFLQLASLLPRWGRTEGKVYVQQFLKDSATLNI